MITSFGVEGGKQIVPPEYLADATRREIDIGAPGGGGYGYFWWILPSGDYQAVGIFGQSITTFREDRLIIVTNAAWTKPTGKEFSAARTAFIDGMHAAAK